MPLTRINVSLTGALAMARVSYGRAWWSNNLTPVGLSIVGWGNGHGPAFIVETGIL